MKEINSKTTVIIDLFFRVISIPVVKGIDYFSFLVKILVSRQP